MKILKNFTYTLIDSYDEALKAESILLYKSDVNTSDLDNEKCVNIKKIGKKRKGTLLSHYSSEEYETSECDDLPTVPVPVKKFIYNNIENMSGDATYNKGETTVSTIYYCRKIEID